MQIDSNLFFLESSITKITTKISFLYSVPRKIEIKREEILRIFDRPIIIIILLIVLL